MYTGKMFQTGKTGKLMHNWNSNDFPVDESIFQPRKIYWTYQVWNNKKKKIPWLANIYHYFPM